MRMILSGRITPTRHFARTRLPPNFTSTTNRLRDRSSFPCCDQGRYFIHRAYSPACKTGNVDTLFHFSENPTIEVYRANFERGWAFGFGVG